eukprot:4672571-Prorocentrum_lima.AAC.1
MHQSNQDPNQGGKSSNTGPIKAKLVQPVEGNMDWNKMTNDHIMTALVKLAHKRVLPHARTRSNIIP